MLVVKTAFVQGYILSYTKFVVSLSLNTKKLLLLCRTTLADWLHWSLNLSQILKQLFSTKFWALSARLRFYPCLWVCCWWNKRWQILLGRNRPGLKHWFAWLLVKLWRFFLINVHNW